MRIIGIIGFQSLQLIIKEKTSMIWMLIVPCIYIFVFGSAFRGGGDPAQSRADLAVYNQDNGFLSGELIKGLQSENLDVDSLSLSPEEHPTRMLHIPENFTEQVLKGREVTLTFSKKPDTHIEAAATAEMAIRKAYIRILANLTEISMSGKKEHPGAFQEINDREPLIRLATGYAGKHIIIPRGFSNQVPANIIQFTMIMLFIFAGNSILEERKRGLFRRIQIGPVHFYELFLGKLLYVLLVGLSQVSILLIFGHFVFGVYYGHSPVSLILLILIYCIAVGSMGLCLGFIIKSEEKLLGIALVSALSMAALSGCWWPLEITPIWMQRLANFLPSGLALKAFHQLISYGRGFEAIWPHLLGLAGFGSVFSVLFAKMIAKQGNK